MELGLKERLMDLREEALALVQWSLESLRPRDKVLTLIPFDDELLFGVEWIDGKYPNLVLLDSSTRAVVGDVDPDALSTDLLVELASFLIQKEKEEKDGT